MIEQPRIGIYLGIRISESDIFLLQGITSYTRERGVWQFAYSEAWGLPILSEADLKDWQGDGLLTLIPDHPLVLKKLSEGIPVVSMSYEQTNLPYQVLVNRRMCGVLGAQHLMAQGFTSFALLFGATSPFCELDQGYIETLQTEGFCAVVNQVPNYLQTVAERRDWCLNWVASLKKPVGIMTSQETLGSSLLSICEQLEYHVPNQVGILTVTAGQINCDSHPIGLSRVKIDLKQVGYEAACMLGQLLKKEEPSPNLVWIIPDTIILRESTNRLHPQDHLINRALHYMQMNADKRISVGDVVQSTGVSRSTLQSRFRQQLGRTIQEEIRTARIERVKTLLLNTNLDVCRIAANCGFIQASRLTEAFKRETGMAPIEFRKRSPAGNT